MLTNRELRILADESHLWMAAHVRDFPVAPAMSTSADAQRAGVRSDRLCGPTAGAAQTPYADIREFMDLRNRTRAFYAVALLTYRRQPYCFRYARPFRALGDSDSVP